MLLLSIDGFGGEMVGLEGGSWVWNGGGKCLRDMVCLEGR